MKNNNIEINNNLNSIDDFFKHYNTCTCEISKATILQYGVLKKYRSENKKYRRSLLNMSSRYIFLISEYLNISMDQVYSDFIHIEENRKLNRKLNKVVK